ncbi:phosphatidate cytidylyltransferase [Lacipirellula limnantheis]|uniref:Phosphatidate cytidylyltransferase n=1 Tax=Lacipirellula limnantheis TaxID=2528024 RepID=A0A517TUV6_9BACT|nr:phosphatidate cytidylyltransferase [Lacipirellula limnantheis]QDT72137.1 Phosphatidate cytidylyltransferase [Lacipirellula limnantheis]
MLRWRLILGVLLVAGLAGLCWLDAHAPWPGLYLGPVAILAAVLATGEMLRMFRAQGHEPTAWPAYVGTLLPVAVSCAAVSGYAQPPVFSLGRLGWLALALVAGLGIAIVGEMRRYESPGHSIVRLSLTALSVLYVGGLLGMLVQLRLVEPYGYGLGAWGQLLPLLSLIATVKLSDTMQYTFGRLFGKHKVAPRLSPGKTWEGTIGGIGSATLIASGALAYILQGSSGLQPLMLAKTAAFALTVTIVGIIGDLAESMLKRDAGVKDSSDWLPGFGGVLDILDSLLLAAPVAYLFWGVAL